MKISDIIMILLFIIPGYICTETCSWLTAPSKNKKLEFKELARMIFWSCPTVFIAGIVFGCQYKLQNLSDMLKKIDNISILIHFIALVLVVSLILGIIGGLTKEYWFKFINWIRQKVLKRFSIHTDQCWEKLFGIGTDSHYLEIIKDGKTIAKGFGIHFSLTDETKELILNTPETWKDYPEMESKFTKILNTYVDLEKCIIINDYDRTDYENYCKKLWSEYQ